MRIRRVLAALTAAVAVAGCTTGGSAGGLAPGSPGSPGSTGSTSSGTATGATGPSAAPALVASALQVPAGLVAEPFDRARSVQAPPGWRVRLWARVPGARLAAWTPRGTLLVSRPGAGQVVELTPAAGSGTPSQRVLAEGLTQPHGLAFAGSTLYVAESDKVTAWTSSQAGLSGRRVVVDGLPDEKSPDLRGAYAHALKSVAVGPDGSVYVSVGSTGNVSAEDRDADPQRASVLRIPPGGGAPQVHARGVRNGTGLAVDPTGAVWTAVNHRDNVAYPFDRDYDGDGTSDRGAVLQAYVNDHPLEPLARLTPGRDLGWPYCNPDPDVDPGAPGSALTYGARPFLRDEQTNPDGDALDCSALPPVEQGMGAHSAPLGLSFVGPADAAASRLPAAYREGALVGIHGSWNRRPPRRPEVAFFPWRAGTLGAQQTLLAGFQDADGRRWGRPVMALLGPDGAIYVTDDAAGAVYRMAPQGS